MNKITDLGIFSVALKDSRTVKDITDKSEITYYNLTIVSEDGTLGDVINVSEAIFNKTEEGKSYNIKQFTRTVEYVKDGKPASFTQPITILTDVE